MGSRKGREETKFSSSRLLVNKGTQLSLMAHLGKILKLFYNLVIWRLVYVAAEFHAGLFTLKYIVTRPIIYFSSLLKNQLNYHLIVTASTVFISVIEVFNLSVAHL